MITQNKRLLGILLTAAFLLLIPFISGAPWSRFDFVVAGVVLFGGGLVFELVLRLVKNTKHRIIICGAVLAALFIIWVELAVGLFGTRFAGN